jgi:DNA-binding NarL/FixJ family response regulator
MEEKKFDYYEFKNLDFNKAEYEYFLENCNFTDRQKDIFELRRKGKSYIEIEFSLNISQSTITREIKKIKHKILKII